MASLEVDVHVNRGSAPRLQTAVGTVETCEPFEVHLHGHGAPGHVHCRLDDALGAVASIDDSNYYVDADDVTPVPIAIDADHFDEPIEGQLDLVTGYGAESITIDITVLPGPQRVDVDDSLAEPNRSPPEPSVVDRLVAPLAALTGLDAGTIAVIAFGALTLTIATATAATIGGPVTFGGLAIVVIGVAVAIAVLLW